MAQRILKTLALVAVAVVVIAEIGLRVVPRSVLPRLKILDRVYSARAAWNDMMSGDPYLGYKLRPAVSVSFPSEGRLIDYRTESYGLGDIGFRDVGTKPPFDMVVVGGSFAVCDDVPPEACWVRKLSDALGMSTATMAVNGYSTIAASRMLERYGMRLHPKVVLLEVHPNDFRDNINFTNWEKSKDPNLWNWLGKHHGRTESNRWLSEHLMLYRLLDGYNRGYRKEIFPYNHDHLDLVFRFDSWFVSVAGAGAQHPGWPLVQQSLRDVEATARDGGARAMMVLFPTKEQTYWDLIGDRAPAAIRGKADQPLDLVVEFCRANGIAYCDLRGPLRQAAHSPAQLYHRISTHMNDLGNDVSARGIEECLRRQQFVPAGDEERKARIDGH